MSTTQTGILIGATLALTWVLVSFWAFFFVAVAMAIGAMVGRIVEGKLNPTALVDALRGRRSAS